MNTNIANDYWITLKQQKHRLLRIIAVCTVFSLLSYFVLPKTYKVTSMISLQTEYFQLPLVSGFMPETLDPAELKSKREALLRLALNQQFLGEIATRYNLVKDPSNSYDLDLLSKKFEMIPNGTSAFIINFTAKDPNLAYQVLQDFLTRLQTIMGNERHTLLLNLHDAIQEQLETISVGKQGDGANAIYSVRPDLAQHRIEKIQEEIESLKNSYSEKHPRITALKEQIAQLSQWAKPYAEAAPVTQNGDIFSGVKVDDASKELFDDLLKKYRYLEVVIFMDQQNKDHYMSVLNEPYVPHAPVFPKLPILLAWGIALGFLIGSLLILFKELPKKVNQPFTVVATPPPSPLEGVLRS